MSHNASRSADVSALPFDISKSIVYPSHPTTPPPFGEDALYELPDGRWFRVESLPEGRLRARELSALAAYRWFHQLGRSVPPRLQLLADAAASSVLHSTRSSSTDVGTTKTPPVELRGQGEQPVVLGKVKPVLSLAQYNVLMALMSAGPVGYSKDELDRESGHTEARKILRRLAASDPDWAKVVKLPGSPGKRYRLVSH
jgi:hypothetical protein